MPKKKPATGAIRIKKGTPPPSTNELFPLRQLKVGEYLLVTDESKWGYLRVRASKLKKNSGLTFSVRKEKDGIRVYRTA